MNCSYHKTTLKRCEIPLELSYIINLVDLEVPYLHMNQGAHTIRNIALKNCNKFYIAKFVLHGANTSENVYVIGKEMRF